jgi:hypothetical protein
MVDEVFPKIGASLWQSLGDWRGKMDHSSPILTELTTLMDSLYAPNLRATEFKIPQEEYLTSSKCTIHTLA